MKLHEVLEPIPGLRRALLHVQQEIIEHDDSWESEIVKTEEDEFFRLRVKAHRSYKLEPDESSEVRVDLHFEPEDDGHIRAYVNLSPSALVIPDKWDSPDNLEHYASLVIRRMNQKLARNRTMADRLHSLKMLERKFPQGHASCHHSVRSGIAFMSDTSHAKLYVYVADPSDAPNYKQGVGYVIMHGTALEPEPRPGTQYVELIQDVEKLVKKWVKANS